MLKNRSKLISILISASTIYFVVIQSFLCTLEKFEYQKCSLFNVFKTNSERILSYLNIMVNTFTLVTYTDRADGVDVL